MTPGDAGWWEGQHLYHRPLTLEEATHRLAGGPYLLLGGGTDVYPAHAGKPVAGRVIDLTHVAEMLTIGESDGEFRIGGAVTWSRLIAAPLPPAFDAVKQAAREVGSKQIQNRGTLAGNLCNASPAADGVPPLLALDAEVELASQRGLRRLPLSSFMTGYRSTARAADEILSAVCIPRAAVKGRSAFVKLGSRRYLVISIVMAAARIVRTPAGAISDAAIAVGAASPAACRLSELERDLLAAPRGISPAALVAPHHLRELAPISDVRAPAEYRLDAGLQVVRSALDRAWSAGAP